MDYIDPAIAIPLAAILWTVVYLQHRRDKRGR